MNIGYVRIVQNILVGVGHLFEKKDVIFMGELFLSKSTQYFFETLQVFHRYR